MTAVESDLLDRVRTRLAEQRADLSPARVAEALRREGRLVGDTAVLAVVDALRRDTTGAGPLDALLHGDDVTDVLVNGPDHVYVDSGEGLRRVDLRFPCLLYTSPSPRD